MHKVKFTRIGTMILEKGKRYQGIIGGKEKNNYLYHKIENLSKQNEND